MNTLNSPILVTIGSAGTLANRFIPKCPGAIVTSLLIYSSYGLGNSIGCTIACLNCPCSYEF